MPAHSSNRASDSGPSATFDASRVTDRASWVAIRKRWPFYSSDRRMWPALVVSSLAALVGCDKDKTEEEKAALKPAIAVSQAEAAQSALTAAQASQGTHAVMPTPGNVGGAPAASKPATDGAPMNMGDPMAAGRTRLLGQAPEVGAAGELPPAAGAPHLYHLGAENFFIERAVALGFTTQQEAQLSAIKEKAERTYGATQQEIDQAERDLWTLTSAEKPNAGRISDKISEIARLGAQQRMDYVRAVGSAVAVLNDAQREAVIASAPAAMPAAGTAPAGGGMKMGDRPMTQGGAGGAMAMGTSAGGGTSGMGKMKMHEDDDMPMKPKGMTAPNSGMAGASSQDMGHM